MANVVGAYHDPHVRGGDVPNLYVEVMPGSWALRQTAANYVWDAGANNWVKMTQPGGGGGGGIVTQGARDATAQAWLVDGSATTQPVSGTFWQATQPVSGTFWQVTQPVSVAALPLPSGAATETTLAAVRDRLPAALVGGRLDVNLGATITVPVSGTFWQATQPVSGTFWQATQPVSGTFWQATQPVSGTFWQATQPVSIAAAVDVSDRAIREVGRVRMWDGIDEASVLPARTQPATTEKMLVVGQLPTRVPTYGSTTTTITPAITVGVKELLALWHASTDAKDIYIMEIWATGQVNTASTAGRSALRVSTITTAPTGGTETAKVDVTGAGASGMTNTMQVKTGGGAVGSTFIRKLAWRPAQPLGEKEISLFQAVHLEDALIMRGGVNAGFSIDIEREVAHTALVDVWTVGVRWLEL